MSAKQSASAKGPAPAAEHTVRLRIRCLQPPDPRPYGAEFGLQDNSSTADWVLHAGAWQKNGDVVFECDCRVRPQANSGAPNFLGPFVQGSPAQRFLYLSWKPSGWKPGTPEPTASTWVRRMKIHLRSITWEQIRQAAKSGAALEATAQGTGRGGGPACASVSLLGGGWKLE